MDGVLLFMVGQGYNEAFMPIGLFETRKEAEDAVLAMGAERKIVDIKRWTGKKDNVFEIVGQREGIFVTEAFKNAMELAGMEGRCLSR